MEKSILEVQSVSVAYTENPVLENVSFQLPPNSMTAVIGPNGAGKSTLIKAILNMQKKISGQVKIFGQDYKKVFNKIAYVPQIGNVEWDFPTTVADVVMMGRYPHRHFLKGYSKEDSEAVLVALKKVAMEDFSKRQIAELSGGQRQRVFLARAIVQDANLYFLDEPLQGVDKKTEEMIIRVLKDFRKQGKSIVVVHHDLETVPQYFTHAIIMNKVLIASGKVSDAFTKENLNLAYESEIGDIYGF